ncbi:hypothetical protein [Nocardia sp. BMG51109]|uniref:hypothetical protein n=1 Tax=Nocardia sp. BMG51109 TaxID=1056816 RepID=UPI0004B74753|nr:hypothetical protein [Nocardia sp. BMG51109]
MDVLTAGINTAERRQRTGVLRDHGDSHVLGMPVLLRSKREKYEQCAPPDTV